MSIYLRLISKLEGLYLKVRGTLSQSPQRDSMSDSISKLEGLSEVLYEYQGLLVSQSQRDSSQS